MRVIAGTARGIRLVAPAGERVRPTADRVREATFAMLGSMGLPDGAVVLDLFAGTGASGIEALSRGAAAATFVERDLDALAALRSNLERTRLATCAEVVRADVIRWLAGPGRAVAAAADLAVVDPPYAFDRWAEVWEHLRVPVVVTESDRPVEVGEGYELHRERRYAGTVVRVATLQERSP